MSAANVSFLGQEDQETKTLIWEVLMDGELSHILSLMSFCRPYAQRETAWQRNPSKERIFIL